MCTELDEKHKVEKEKDEKHKSGKKSKQNSTSHQGSSSSKSKRDDSHSSSSKDKHKERKDKHTSFSKDKIKSREDKSSFSKDKYERKSSGPCPSHKSVEPSSGSKRRNTSDAESNDFKAPDLKIARVQQSVNSYSKHAESFSASQEEDKENSFDSSMVVNFDGTLGMINPPSKIRKIKSREDKSSFSKDKYERKSSGPCPSHKSVEPSSGSKRRNTSDAESNDFKAPDLKIARVQQSVNSYSKHVESFSASQEEDKENSFDSSMVVNFDGTLGMINPPSKIRKKPLKSPSICVKDSPKPLTSINIATKSNGVETFPPIYCSQSREDKSSSTYKDKHERKSSGPSSSHKSVEPSSERKRRHTESDDFKSPDPKISRLQQSVNSSPKPVESSSPPQEEDEKNSFDSSMGVNFGDILGILNAPSKKHNKSLKSSSNGGSSNSVKDSRKPSSTNSIGTKSNGVKVSSTIYSPQPASTTSTAKPDLLAPTTKLAPLDPSIVLELPTVPTDYRSTDFVFNTSSSCSSQPVRTLTDAKALAHGITSKSMRTKMYSGAKTGQVPSLADMCTRVLQKNIDGMEYTGGVPFEFLRPILERATPKQLIIFEDYNRYLMEDSDVLWQAHVSRNYRTQKRVENESWREMFIRCQKDEERRLSVLKNTIKQSQIVAAAPVRKTQLAFVDSMAKPPRKVIRKQEQNGTKSNLVATPAARVASLQSIKPNAAKTEDKSLKKSPVVKGHARVAKSSVRPKTAPLMKKTLAFIRARFKR